MRHCGQSRTPPAVAVLAVVTILALAACGSSKKASSGTATAARTSSADRLIEAGIAAETKGDMPRAIADYRGALEADPVSTLAYYDLGVIYQEEKSTADARASYLKALLIDPTYQSALFNLAILDTPTDPTTAVALYDRLLTLRGSDSDVLFNLGLLLRRTGHSTAGNADLTKAAKMDPALAARLPSSTTTVPAPATTTAP